MRSAIMARVRPSLTENVDEAAKVMASLEKAGISMKEVTEKLVVDGVKLLPMPSNSCWRRPARLLASAREP